MQYEFHEYANLFPLIEGGEFSALKSDVLENGVREPVWLYQGKILDGRNRYRAASEVGVTFPVREYEGDTPLAFVVSLNLHRRHLTESQRAAVAAKLETLKHGGSRRIDQDANLHLDPETPAISRAEAAELLNVSPRSVATAKKVQEAAPEVFEQVERGNISVNLAAQVAELPEEEKEAAIEAIITTPEQAKTIAREAVKAHVAHNSGNNEWYTPADYIAAARTVMGGIDTDPATSLIANKTVQADQIFTQDDNGLEQTWNGRVWMNPPYAQPLIAEFSEAVASKFESGEIEQACILVNNATETGWFQRMLQASSAVCFPKSRIRFVDPDGNPSGAPLQGQAVLYMGDKTAAFAEAFGAKGRVLFND